MASQEWRIKFGVSNYQCNLKNPFVKMHLHCCKLARCRLFSPMTGLEFATSNL
jgi:hypothetical protein